MLSTDQRIGGRPPGWRELSWTRVAPLLVVVLFAVLQGSSFKSVSFSNDSYRYARASLEILGHSQADATQEAVKAFCANAARRVAGNQRAAGHVYTAETQQRHYASCTVQNAQGLIPRTAAYQRIFDTRPGYPILVAPAIALFGVQPGMWLADLLMTVAAALVLYRLLRAVGLSQGAALAGQLLYLASPLSYWSMRPLTEAPVNLCVAVALLGAWRLLSGRLRLGAVQLAGAFVVMGAVKYSTASLIGAAFVGAALVLVVTGRRERGVLLLGAISFVTAAAVSLSGLLFSLPGITDSLQDTFTNHFTRPAVPDPWQRLLHLNSVYWPHWVSQQALDPFFAVCAGLATWGLARKRTAALALLCLGVAAAGLGCGVLHPVTDQGDRLWLMAWIPAVVGTAVGLDRLHGLRHGEAGDVPVAAGGAVVPPATELELRPS